MFKLFLSFLVCNFAYSSGIINKSNFSAEYARTLSRNASSDSIDASIYNPAGLINLEDGLYIGFTNQIAIKDYTHTLGTKTFTSDNPTYLYPSFMLNFKKDNYAIFANFFIPAGGGSLKYDEGNIVASLIAIGYTNPDLANTKLNFTSKYYAKMFGISYSFNPKISLAGGIKTVSAHNNYTATLNDSEILNFKNSAGAVSPFISLNINPDENWTIAVKYEATNSLKFTVDKNEQNPPLAPAIGDGRLVRADAGETYYKNLPALLAFGVEYKGIDRLTLSNSINVYLNSLADLSGIEGMPDNSFGDSFELSFSGAYQITPCFKASLGAMYSYTSRSDYYLNKATMEAVLNPYLNHYLFGTGVEYNVYKNMKINLGIMTAIYDKDTYKFKGQDTTLDKKTTVIALGFESKI